MLTDSCFVEWTVATFTAITLNITVVVVVAAFFPMDWFELVGFSLNGLHKKANLSVICFFLCDTFDSCH